MRFQNRRDRFFLGRINERAGVDHEHVGFIGLRRNLHPALEHAAQHDFGVDQILGAAETDHADFR